MIPLNRPLLPSLDKLSPYLKEIDRNRYYTNFGPLNDLFTQRLEGWFLKNNQDKYHVVTCSSATSGLELAISSLNLPPQSKILIPAFTFIATATAVLRMGHIPIAGDCDFESWLMTPGIADAVLSKCAFDAIIPVSAFGVPYERGIWSCWTKKTGIPVIVDAAGAFGTQMPEDGILTVYSLHATKALCAGEGGLIVTNDEELASPLKALTNFGIGVHAQYPNIAGSNTKLSEYHCAVGLASLDEFESQSMTRRNLISSYLHEIKKLPKDTLIHQNGIEKVMAPTIFAVLAKNEDHRLDIENDFSEKEIGYRRWYQPLTTRSPWLPPILNALETPNSINIEKRLIGLPFYVDLTPSEIDLIVKSVANLN